MINIGLNLEKSAFEAIEKGVREVNNSKAFKDYLCFVSKFHQYSFHNTILILNQFPNATCVAGYRAWKDKFNRQVIKGAKAIKILAPYQIRKKGEDDEEYVLTCFKVVNVFDISQTTGEEMPRIVKELEGESEEAKTIIDAISSISEIPIIFKRKKEDFFLSSGARGYFNTKEEIIVISDELDMNQKAKTMCHEFAHSILHKDGGGDISKKEIEAEALAFVICHYFNLDTSDYSFPYIATYAKNIDILKEILIDIKDIAHKTIEELKIEIYTKSVRTNNTKPIILTGNSSISSALK